MANPVNNKKSTTTHTLIARNDHSHDGVVNGTESRIITCVNKRRRGGAQNVVVFTNDSVSRFAAGKFNDTHTLIARNDRSHDGVVNGTESRVRTCANKRRRGGAQNVVVFTND